MTSSLRYAPVRLPWSPFAVALLALAPTAARADDGALARYRKSWNPFSGGPQLVSSADLHPQGQFFVRPYIYSEFGYGQFGDAWSVNRQALPRRLSRWSLIADR